jgi:hypothetical protein
MRVTWNSTLFIIQYIKYNKESTSPLVQSMFLPRKTSMCFLKGDNRLLPVSFMRKKVVRNRTGRNLEM